ncbi:MAG: hydrogenase expression protein [Chloroflexi bacterium]|nr:hydrogenase expression protein [Chloroflexota bacterium]
MLVGKLPNDVLARLLADIPRTDSRVLVGPGVGEDAAVLDFGDRVLIAKTDPITFATDLIGWYAVHINANDVAAMGGRPRWFLASLLLPERAGVDDVARIFAQIRDACGTLGVSLVGGHTEVSYGLDRPILVGCMLGEAAPGGVVRTAGAQVGDAVILTKGIAVEGTAVLAREAAADLVARGIDPDCLARAQRFLFQPGISVVPDCRVALAGAEIHCLHDPTEGGLATALAEVAQAAGVGLLVEEERVPILPETAEVCRLLGLKPLGLLASGSLIITAPAADAAALIAHLAEAGITASAIGATTPAADGLRLRRADGSIVDLPRFARDEVARFFDERPREG